jgi:hypothetical protein
VQVILVFITLALSCEATFRIQIRLDIYDNNLRNVVRKRICPDLVNQLIIRINMVNKSKELLNLVKNC